MTGRDAEGDAMTLALDEHGELPVRWAPGSMRQLLVNVLQNPLDASPRESVREEGSS
jgi:hypothetical protein